ncbi:Antitoxin component YwqK of the YwqJK toxin-antitoxin module [Polaribacter sp. KT25b]|uniref:toxin-antitoxin system YwqK family antitoxin n=1 Tax=Polaribacter sp. KT25b TaxID=1855336 RepID=UPI00087A0529|nr:toxin-antitoxin system YwqK family antitoxin [Polaribacter sp. KT25b]SDR88259.1 Antitoxin component YwqK of the YwqJK toxin-antitoxin module [Polaribacter sp. KT25b]
MLNIKRLIAVFAFIACFFTNEKISAQKINQFNENKQRTGTWIKYYSDDKIRYTGQFENGKEVGVFKFYDISSSKYPVIIKTYSKESQNVLVEFYTIKGKLQSKGYFKDKNRIGNWTYFFSDGKIMSEEVYKEGKLDGKLVNYYPNGKETEITFYVNGLKNGLSQKYSSDGILIEEITFKNGKPNGQAKYFELNGNLKEAGTYLKGKRVGEWEYYLDGEVANKKDIENNKKYKKNENDEK